MVSKVIICNECKHMAVTQERHQAHLVELRHVNHFRSMAYKDPRRRQMWLKLWFREAEKAEEMNPLAHLIDEQEEIKSSHQVLAVHEDVYEHRCLSYYLPADRPSRACSTSPTRASPAIPSSSCTSTPGSRCCSPSNIPEEIETNQNI
eukprot:GFUD01043204.1.p1 GENE.GFUD01043204.1~~GFUD01043204.1.p1  ORF type:complete len:148 (+),score=43.32 GFUD01043204.1:233-676(+)